MQLALDVGCGLLMRGVERQRTLPPRWTPRRTLAARLREHATQGGLAVSFVMAVTDFAAFL
jgi:hypothetical protein